MGRALVDVLLLGGDYVPVRSLCVVHGPTHHHRRHYYYHRRHYYYHRRHYYYHRRHH
jgi:hypothetical protein